MGDNLTPSLHKGPRQGKLVCRGRVTADALPRLRAPPRETVPPRVTVPAPKAAGGPAGRFCHVSAAAGVTGWPQRLEGRLEAGDVHSDQG